jgi:HD-like signal output (HDOD) protein
MGGTKSGGMTRAVQASVQPLSAEEVRRRARICISGLPPFSPVLSQLLASISQPDDSVSLPRLALSIQRDVVLSGKVLSAANSALYSRGQPIYMIAHAVARLGLNPLRNLVLGFSITQLWLKARVPKAFSLERFNRHALATATMAELIAKRVARPLAEEAFVSGLFHDVGQLLMASIFETDYTDFLKVFAAEGGSMEAAEKTNFILCHAELSVEAVTLWKLPARVQFAVRNHEKPAAARNGPEYVALANIVRAADVYADHLGFTLGEDDPAPSCDEVSEQLHLDHEILCREFEHHFLALRGAVS